MPNCCEVIRCLVAFLAAGHFAVASAEADGTAYHEAIERRLLPTKSIAVTNPPVYVDGSVATGQFTSLLLRERPIELRARRRDDDFGLTRPHAASRFCLIKMGNGDRHQILWGWMSRHGESTDAHNFIGGRLTEILYSNGGLGNAIAVLHVLYLGSVNEDIGAQLLSRRAVQMGELALACLPELARGAPQRKGEEGHDGGGEGGHEVVAYVDPLDDLLHGAIRVAVGEGAANFGALRTRQREVRDGQKDQYTEYDDPRGRSNH